MAKISRCAACRALANPREIWQEQAGGNSDVDEAAGEVAKAAKPAMKGIEMNIDEKTRTEIEAAAFRRLLEHLRKRTDVQNIDMMNLAGFCRNCLSNWFEEAAKAKGAEVSRDEARTMVYGMPYEAWKAQHQAAASPEQKAKFEQSHKH